MGGLYDILEAYRQQNEPRFIYEGLYQDPDRFLDYDNSRRDFSGQADYPFTGNIPTNARARYDARAFNRGEPLPLPYGLKGGTFFKDFNPRVGIINPLDPNKYANPVGPMNVNTGIMTQAPDFERFEGITKETDIDDDTQDTVNNIVRRVEDDDLEASAIPEFAEGQLKQSPTGIARLFEFLSNLPTPFNLVRRGLESLSGVNQRLRNTDFGRSKTLVDYFDARKYGGRQAREDARRATMKDAARITSGLKRTAVDDVIDRGRTQESRTAATRSRDLGRMRGGVGR